MTGIRMVNNDDELETMIRGLGMDRCIVVFFFLPWCPACSKITPFVENLAEKNPNTLFIKVDAERSQSSSKKHRVSKVPIFILYNNRTKVDRVEGASPIELETKIKRIQNDLDYKQGQLSTGYGMNNGILMGSSQQRGQVPPKMTDISEYLDRRNCQVVNDLLPSSLQEFLEGNRLVSGKGIGRLLLVYTFTEKMVIQSFKIKAPVHSGPRVLRFFTNVRNVDINMVNQMNAAQEVMLSEDDLLGDHLIDLRQGGFVGINSLQVFIPENMTKSRRIEIDHLTLNGAPLSMTPYSGSNPMAMTSGGIGAGGGTQQLQYGAHNNYANNRRY